MENTKNKIIHAAVDIFVEKGFSGASISMIAKSAGVNQSLIYHHIGSKEQLWAAARESLISEIEGFSFLRDDYENLREVLEDMAEYRIRILAQDKRRFRFIQWQRLVEDSQINLVHMDTAEKWFDIIDKLKAKGKVNKKYKTELIFTHIFVMATDFLDDSCGFFKKHPELLEEYIEMFIDQTDRMFSS